MPSANIRFRWKDSDLEVYDAASGNTIYTIDDAGAVNFESGKLKYGGTAVTSTAAELNVLHGIPATLTAAELGILDGATATATELSEYSLNVYMADANTAGSVFVVCPHAGAIRGLSVVPYANNGGADCVFTAEIGGVAVTHGAWAIAAAGAAGTHASVVPTAANVVTADSVLELISDGGGNTVMPVMFTVKILR